MTFMTRSSWAFKSCIGLCAVAALVCCIAADDYAAEPQSESPAIPLASDFSSAAPQPDRYRDSASTKPGERQREGTKLIDQVGTFEFLGDRAAFLPAGAKDSYRVLENLALERLSRQQIDSRGQQEWTISGVLTEFKGANYLLVTKAVARSGSAR